METLQHDNISLIGSRTNSTADTSSSSTISSPSSSNIKTSSSTMTTTTTAATSSNNGRNKNYYYHNSDKREGKDKKEDHVRHKFVPKAVEDPGKEAANKENNNSENICDLQQSSVISCLEKVAGGDGNCNDAFAKWNDCLAKGYGYL
jgi:Predicted solute binding protein